MPYHTIPRVKRRRFMERIVLLRKLTYFDSISCSRLHAYVNFYFPPGKQTTIATLHYDTLHLPPSPQKKPVTSAHAKATVTSKIPAAPHLITDKNPTSTRVHNGHPPHERTRGVPCPAPLLFGIRVHAGHVMCPHVHPNESATVKPHRQPLGDPRRSPISTRQRTRQEARARL